MQKFELWGKFELLWWVLISFWCFTDSFRGFFELLEIIFSVPDAKVEILRVDLKFKGEFLGNLNWKFKFFAKIWTLGAGVLNFWGLLIIFYFLAWLLIKSIFFWGKILAWFWGYLPRELIDFYWELVRKLEFWDLNLKFRGEFLANLN